MDTDQYEQLSDIKLFGRVEYRLLSMLMFSLLINYLNLGLNMLAVFFSLGIISDCKRSLWFRSLE